MDPETDDPMDADDLPPVRKPKKKPKPGDPEPDGDEDGQDQDGDGDGDSDDDDDDDQVPPDADPAAMQGGAGLPPVAAPAGMAPGGTPAAMGPGAAPAGAPMRPMRKGVEPPREGRGTGEAMENGKDDSIEISLGLEDLLAGITPLIEQTVRKGLEPMAVRVGELIQVNNELVARNGELTGELEQVRKALGRYEEEVLPLAKALSARLDQQEGASAQANGGKTGKVNDTQVIQKAVSTDPTAPPADAQVVNGLTAEDRAEQAVVVRKAMSLVEKGKSVDGYHDFISGLDRIGRGAQGVDLKPAFSRMKASLSAGS